MISLGGERRAASENERQVEGLCSVKNTFAWDPQGRQVQHAHLEWRSELRGSGLSNTREWAQRPGAYREETGTPYEN